MRAPTRVGHSSPAMTSTSSAVAGALTLVLQWHGSLEPAMRPSQPLAHAQSSDGSSTGGDKGGARPDMQEGAIREGDETAQQDRIAT